MINCQGQIMVSAQDLFRRTAGGNKLITSSLKLSTYSGLIFTQPLPVGRIKANNLRSYVSKHTFSLLYMYLSVTACAVIGQFSSQYSTIGPTKIQSSF